jgi:anti-sigma B factor antagonist
MTPLDVEFFGVVPVARPCGDIDVSTANGLREELSECLAPGTDELVLDLRSVGYVDSAGLDMLFRLGELLRQRRAVLRLVVSRGSQLDRLFDIVGLRAAVAVYESSEEALATHAAGST